MRQAYFILTALILAGCQPNGQSYRPIPLEEAKEIIAEFEGQSYIPPPRTIADITRILQQPNFGDNPVTQRVLQEANAEPPVTDDPIKLWRFYKLRGRARHMLGRSQDALQDLQKSLKFVLSTGRNDGQQSGVHPRKDYDHLSESHRALGNQHKAIEYAELAGDLTPKRSVELNTHAFWHAINLAESGDLDGADNALTRADPAIEDARRWNKRDWVPVILAVNDHAKAHLLRLRGDYARAEREFRKILVSLDRDIRHGASPRLFGSVGVTLGEARLRMKFGTLGGLAQSLMGQGRWAEAEAYAREAVIGQVNTFGRQSADGIEEIVTLVNVLEEQGKFEQAVALAEAAIEIFEGMGAGRNSHTYAMVRRMLGDALVGQQRWSEAFGIYQEIERDLRAEPDRLANLLQLNLNWALAYLQSDNAEAAISRLSAVYQRLTERLGPDHYETSEAEGLLASALAWTQEFDRARHHFERAVPILLDQKGLAGTTGTTRSSRRIRLEFILDAYIQTLVELAATEPDERLKRQALSKAFSLADATRLQSVQAALSAAASRAASGDPDLAELARAEQDTANRITAINSLLSRVGVFDADSSDDTVQLDLRRQLREQQAARASITSAIAARFPAYADLIEPKPATVEAVRRVLRPEEALVAIHSTPENSFVCALSSQGSPSFASSSLGNSAIRRLVGQVRLAVDPATNRLGAVPAFDVALAYRLYEELLLPVRHSWNKATVLIIVADGALAQLPFSILPTQKVVVGEDQTLLFEEYRRVPWLVRTHAVSSLPSAAALLTLRAGSVRSQGLRQFVGFGDPWFNRQQANAGSRQSESDSAILVSRSRKIPINLRALPRLSGLASVEVSDLPRLPDTAEEVRAIARVLGADLSRDIFLGKAANERNVKNLDLSTYKVIAFATHGLIPGDLNGLTQPALAMSHPEVAGIEGDGLLTMGEILELRLDADWVVLSACNTGSADGAGAEALSGLGRAFFYAGARTLLVSHWPVETTSATALTTKLFEHQVTNPNISRAEALQQSMLNLIDGPGFVDREGRSLYSYSHPIFWSPFAIVGEGRGAELAIN